MSFFAIQVKSGQEVDPVYTLGVNGAAVVSVSGYEHNSWSNTK